MKSRVLAVAVGLAVLCGPQAFAQIAPVWDDETGPRLADGFVDACVAANGGTGNQLAWVAAEQCIRDSYNACLATRTNGGNMHDMWQCIAFASNAWDRRVGERFGHVAQLMPDDLKDRLSASQADWRQLTSDVCLLVYDFLAPGSIGPLEAGFCFASHYAQRAFELDAMSWWLDRQ